MVSAGATIAPAYASIYAMVDHGAPQRTVTEALAFTMLSTAAVTGASGGFMGYSTASGMIPYWLSIANNPAAAAAAYL